MGKRKYLFWKVFKSVALRIQTVDDLNDFYAYMDDIGGSLITYKSPEEYLDKLPSFCFLAPLSEQDRINDLVSGIFYEVGAYNEDNVKRILGRYFGHEYRMLFTEDGKLYRRN